MINFYSYPELFGVADNNGYGLKAFAFLKLAGVPFVHQHLFDASAAPHDTRETEATVWRRRKCLDCGYRWSTYEVSAASSLEQSQVIQQLRDLQAQFEAAGVRMKHLEAELVQAGMGDSGTSSSASTVPYRGASSENSESCSG